MSLCVSNSDVTGASVNNRVSISFLIIFSTTKKKEGTYNVATANCGHYLSKEIDLEERQ